LVGTEGCGRLRPHLWQLKTDRAVKNRKPLRASCHKGALILAETVSAYAVLSED